jgi:hypothetical protein
MKWYKPLLLASSILLLMTACGVLQVGILPSPTAPAQTTSTSSAPLETAAPPVLPTDTAEIPTATLAPTSEPATQTPQQVSPSPLPASQTTPLSTPVEMAPGATSVSLDSSVANRGRSNYQVNAQAGQFLLAMLTSPNSNLFLQIQAPDGTVLVPSSQELNFWQGTLPQSGNYIVSVISTRGDANFNLIITIPVRVTFKSGAVSAALDGQVAARETNTYLLRALKGQTMTVTVDSPDKDIFLTIYGLEDGTPYVRSATGQTQSSFKLPSTQDYVIQLVSTSDAPESYTVTFHVK